MVETTVVMETTVAMAEMMTPAVNQARDANTAMVMVNAEIFFILLVIDIAVMALVNAGTAEVTDGLVALVLSIHVVIAIDLVQIMLEVTETAGCVQVQDTVTIVAEVV